MKLKRGTSRLIISIAFFVMSVCVFGPLELYITNQSEFWFSFTDTLKISALMSLIATVVLLFTGMVLRGKWRSLYTTVLFSITLCLYLQGNILNIDYGILDGKSIDWSAYGGYAVLNTVIWIGVIGTFIILWKMKRKLCALITRYISVFIMATQALTLGILIFTSGCFSTTEDIKFYVADKNLYTLGEKENIVVFVLDAFDEEYLEEIFAEEPEKYHGIFEDFTHYTNVAVGGATTNSALPILISGMPYPGEMTYEDYLIQSFNTDKLYTELKKQEYNINIYTDQAYVTANMLDYVDNLIDGQYRVSSLVSLAQKYGSLTLYKYVPHVFKRYFWLYTGDFDAYKTADRNDYGAYAMDDVDFYNRLLAEGLRIDGKKTYSMIHTTGTHPPYNMNEYAQPAENVTPIQKGKGQLLILSEYLDQMKELGVYDNSTIIVTCDHGQKNLARGMMLIKKPFAEGYQENDAPVSHFDLHNTIFELLGIEKGESIFDIKEGAERVRMYYPQEGDSGLFTVGEYMITGNPKDGESINGTGRIFAPVQKRVKYHLGEKLTFGSDGTSIPYIEKGVNSWYHKFAWTDGKEVIFRFELDSAPKKDYLELSFDCYTVYLKICNQNLTVFVDDQEMFHELITSDATRTFSVDIPAELAKDRELIVRFALPDVRSPKEVFGEGNDPNELGLALTGMSISEVDLSGIEKYEFGTLLTFGANTNASQYVRYGITEDTESTAAWTDNHEILMRIPFKRVPKKDLRVEFNVANVFTDFGNQRVIVKANNVTCFEEIVDSAKDISFMIPKELVNSGELMLRIYLPDAKNPYLLTGEGDHRTLGLALTGLKITQEEN